MPHWKSIRQTRWGHRENNKLTQSHQRTKGGHLQERRLRVSPHRTSKVPEPTRRNRKPTKSGNSANRGAHDRQQSDPRGAQRPPGKAKRQPERGQEGAPGGPRPPERGNKSTHVQIHVPEGGGRGGRTQSVFVCVFSWFFVAILCFSMLFRGHGQGMVAARGVPRPPPGCPRNTCTTSKASSSATFRKPTKQTREKLRYPYNAYELLCNA